MTSSADLTARQSELDDPVVARKPEAFPARFADFWWVQVPVKLRRYSTLLWAVWSDGLYLTAWPRLALMLVFAVLIFGFFEGSTHWSYRTIVGTNGFAGNVLAPSATADNWGGPTRLIFADNLLLLLVAAGLGSLSANLGMTLVIGYVLGDVVHGSVPSQPGWRPIDPVNAWIYKHVPLLTSYVLFLLLAAVTIVMAIELARTSSEGVRRSKSLTVGLTAAIQALLILCWGCLAPMVFRTVLLWAGGVPRITVPFYRDITLAWLVPAAILGVLGRAALFGAARNNQEMLHRLDVARRQARETGLRLPTWARALVLAGVATLLLMGFLHTPSNFEPQLLTNFDEAEIIFVGLLAASLASMYWLPRMAFWQRWVAEIERYPAVLRLTTATIVASIVCLLIIAIPGAQSEAPGEFGPEVAAILAGLGLTLVLLPNGWLGLPQSSRLMPRVRPPALSPATKAGIVLVLVLLPVRNAFADCADFICCFVSTTRAVGAAVAATAVAGAIPLLGGLLGGSGPRSSPESLGRSTAGQPSPSSVTNAEGNTVRARGKAAHTSAPLTQSETGTVRGQDFTPTPTPEGTPMRPQPSGVLTRSEGGAMRSQPTPVSTTVGSSSEGIGSAQTASETAGADLLPEWWQT